MTATALLQWSALQGGATTASPIQFAAQLLGVGIAAATAAGLVALGYRWYVRERVPTGLGILFGLSVVVVLYLGTTGALGQVISGDDAVLDSAYVLRNLSTFAVGAVGSSLGIRAGDALGTDIFAATGGRTVDADVSGIVQSVGRVTSVKLPDDIDDIVGYDPMPEETKTAMAGRRFLFPKRLTKNELRERLIDRLKTDYGVGHVDLELGDDGAIEYIAVGSRASGIGPTLPPATNAVAIRADPANAASSGDLVQVWTTDPLERVVTGELRGVAGDVVTVAIDAADTPKLDPTVEYRLVTLPVQDRPDREFASLLRAAEETMGTVTVPAGSELVGTTVGELAVTVAAITPEAGSPEAIPSRGRTLAAGDVIYAIATPEALRRVETAAGRQRPAEPASDAGAVASDSDDGIAAGAPDDGTTADDTEMPAGDTDAETPVADTDTETTAGEPDGESASEPDDEQSASDRDTGTPASAPETGPQSSESDDQSTDEPDDGDLVSDPASSDTGDDIDGVTNWEPPDPQEETESATGDDESTDGDEPADGESSGPGEAETDAEDGTREN